MIFFMAAEIGLKRFNLGNFVSVAMQRDHVPVDVPAHFFATTEHLCWNQLAQVLFFAVEDP